MNFSLHFRSLRGGKTYSQSQSSHPKMSVYAENNTDASEAHDTEGIDGTVNWFSSELIEEKIGANLEPLNAQISTFTLLLNQLIPHTSRKLPRKQDLHSVEKPEPPEPCQSQ